MAPLITWFGDDFTGSAATMEVLAFAGLETVLFSDIPSPALLERFTDAQAIGIASTARTHGPDWMRANLPAPFTFLHRLGAPLLHYKVCSTFDSAPHSGNIGTAIEIGLKVTGAKAAPMITGAPQMRRYQAFGHLFAGTFDGVFRLDRHPVMARHPVTPMDESDLLRHLAAQTDLPSALIDLEALWSGPEPALDDALRDGARILSIDSMDPASELAAGRLIWQNVARLGFAVGSQGIEYALVRHWQETGLIPPPATVPSAGPVAQIAAVSGSVSPITAQQINWSAANGFEIIRFDAARAIADPAVLSDEIDKAIAAGVQAAAQGASPLICSATGPDDPAVAAVRKALSLTGTRPEDANEMIGKALGRILDGILTATGIRRAVISGGDTSGHGMRALGLEALQALAPTIPGVSLCKAYGTGPHYGLEIALKGGQMGSADFFGWIREGGGAR
ncbi:four-carbon acid sugar kinase family protein [Primorskyibacter sp. 2E107]|uniref:four-carbon acid sugar kinase family protein n=1 Tax=Primorskyibacter sp. 2E107 TaxID=3403458 RepID=UPI003AF52EE2